MFDSKSCYCERLLSVSSRQAYFQRNHMDNSKRGIHPGQNKVVIKAKIILVEVVVGRAKIILSLLLSFEECLL